MPTCSGRILQPILSGANGSPARSIGRFPRLFAGSIGLCGWPLLPTNRGDDETRFAGSFQSETPTAAGSFRARGFHLEIRPMLQLSANLRSAAALPRSPRMANGGAFLTGGGRCRRTRRFLAKSDPGRRPVRLQVKGAKHACFPWWNGYLRAQVNPKPCEPLRTCHTR